MASKIAYVGVALAINRSALRSTSLDSPESEGGRGAELTRERWVRLISSAAELGEDSPCHEALHSLFQVLSTREKRHGSAAVPAAKSSREEGTVRLNDEVAPPRD